ncbi:uncharacterized protein LOC110981206 [Acanthaster planci]|uniref:Uncharacterized protein LOC110981206 n=1 Tax=Acanthaster planci TaxID=133434 RepID=A0A8B7YP90_ACAPL|nr:uncharacterized protein LOC110981206 [Acanthaster planci]
METTSEDLTSTVTTGISETPISSTTAPVDTTTEDFQFTVSTTPLETTVSSTTLTVETTSGDFQSTVSTAPSETTASSTTLTMETTSEDLTSTVTTGISETPISSATAPVDTTTEDLTSAVTTGVSETPASSLTPTVDTTSEVLTTEVETTTSSASLTVETTSEVSTVPSGTTVLSTTLTMETTSEALTSATTSGISETPTLSGTPPVDTTSEASTAPLETTVSSTTLTMETTSADLTSAATTGISETPISSATTPLETTTEESTSMMTSVVFETLTSSATPTVETTTKDSESTVSTSPSKTTASSTSLIVETTSKDVTYATTTGVSKTPISSGTPPAEATTQDFQSTASTAPSETTSSSTTLTMETTSEDLTSTVTNVVSETPIFSAPSTVETTTKALTSTVTSGVPETPTLSATPPVQKTTENFQSTASTAPLETTASSRTLTVETTSEDIKSTASTQRAGTTPSLHTSPVPTTTGTTTEAKPTCAPGEFDCGQLVCISGLFQCDGNRDCEDGSDEDNCVGCRNYCFQEEPRGDCYCDASCEKFGDCCEDYYEYCTLPAYTTKSPGVNECDPEKPLHDCNENAFCTDTPEGFNCTCNEGYEGNGKSCNDIEPPRIDCPANFTEYTDCRKENSTISLPNVNSASDNSGEYTIRVDVQGKEYQVGDTVTLALEGSPHLLRYIATDDSSNRRACDSFVNVTSVNDGSSCLTTGSPPNCICSSNQEGSCTCSAGYCGHDCSQNDVGTLCTGPKEPYPNCEGVNKCSPGFTGPTCKEPSSEINCPEVANQCLKWGVNSVSIQWTQVKAVDSSGNPISPADITCQDVKGATSVELTGGEFKIGEHEVVCSSDTGGVVVPVCLISFTVSSNPTFKVPEIGDQCTDLGKSTSNVTWDIVPAADEEDVTIICTGSEGSTDVGPTGGVFKVGAHTVTCTATNSGGCIKSKIFGFSVLEGNIIPFGVEMGDSLLSDAFQENQQTSKDLISPTIFPPNFFPFCDELYESLYFTDNGVIVLSNDKSLEKWAFPNIPGLQFPNGPPMIAPFWADVQAETFSPESNVFWQVYDQYDPNTNQYMLDTIKDIVSKVVDIRNNTNAVYWALAITWSNVQPVSSSYASGTNTFQVLLLTDSIHSYVVFNYGPCNMNWDTAFLPNKNVILGYTCGMSKESVYLDVPKNSLFRPGSFVGNSGQKGRWVFQLDNHLDDFVNPRLSCRNWYSRQAPYPIFDVYYPSFANTCPCSLIMAWFDWRFLLTWRQSYIPPGEVSEYFQDQSVLCFVRLFQLSGTPGTQCCYKRWTGDLLYDVRSPKVASVFERFPYSDLFYTADAFQEWYEEEVLSRYYCCEKSTLCHLYIEWRPLVTCSRYFPTFWGWFWGDPHVRTLDGVDYTFNGLGEYTLVLIEDENRKEKLFELQGRTKRVYNPEMGELTNATSYSGFAAEDVASDGRVEIKLNEQATNLITTVNGEVVEPTAAGLVISGLTVRKVEDPPKVEAIFASDIQFSVGVNNSFVDVTVQLSQDFEGKTKGLLGVWDGNKTNDILRRDGTYQSPSGSNGTMLENDYFEFGETWRVSVNDSLFYYQSPEESWEKINDLSFRPKFLDELLAGVSEEERQQIKEVCGDNKECIYDALTLNDTDIGIATLQLNEKNSEDLKSATNYPPELTQFETIEVTVGQNFTQQIDATDPDGDEVAIYLLEAVEGASIKDGLFNWTPADKSKVRIGFLASDGKANSSLEPIVNLCDCKNDGTCLLNQYAEGTNLIQDRFGVLLCQCTSGWTGEFCQVDYNACAVSPCFSEVTCTDETPPSLNSTCGPCPDGLEGDGKTCTDIDECERYKDDPARGCEQICENTLRSFNCSCNSGYFLKEDKKTCRALSATDCLNEGEFDESSHECICPLTHYGPTCADENPCLSDNTLCSEEGQHCLPESNTVGFACYCRGFDGYVEITLDGSCEAYASVGVMLTAKMEFVIAYKNPTSTAFNKTAAMFERAIQERLQEMPSTNNLVKIQVTRMDEGSLIITAVVSYGTIPSLDEVKKVLSSSDSLTDGNTTIPIDPDSVRVQKLSSDCLLECLNGGTCERPDYSPIDSCRCSPGYAGDRCETGVEPVPDGLPTVALALIVVGCILFVLVIIPGVIYIVMRKNFRKKVDKVVDGEESRVQEDIRELSLHGELFNDGYEATEFSEEGIRMEYLRRGMPATELKRTKNQNSYIPSFHRNDME